MSTFKTSKDTTLDLTMVEVKGKISASDIVDWIVGYYRRPPTKSILIDFRKADLSGGDQQALERILVQVMESSSTRSGGKTALVFADDIGINLGETFAAFVDKSGLGVRFQAFMGNGDAISWLSE